MLRLTCKWTFHKSFFSLQTNLALSPVFLKNHVVFQDQFHDYIDKDDIIDMI